MDVVLYPMKLKAFLRETLWGGKRLKEEYGKSSDLPNVAESWELSCHPDGLSVIANGPAAGMTLADWIAKNGAEEVMGIRAARFPQFPLLIKLIDSARDLSVQVHPDSRYNWRMEHESGKTEMWYIVDCELGASLLYGFNREVTHDEVRQRVKDRTLLEVCCRVPVHKGDIFFIPAGTLHAIGKGIVLCEIQQSSNTTYRLYDYGRLDPKTGKQRELHVEEALNVLHCGPIDEPHTPEAILDICDGVELYLLRACPFFTAYDVKLNGTSRFRVSNGSFQSFTVLSGSLQVSANGVDVTFEKGETAYLPAGLGPYEVSGRAEYVLSEV